ncbi:Crp/Fnr family transcriptional regulator [Acidaminobacter sp. JC074]|uniref:Crp/Fnr family transcriptional regulator n=1 Tax=Acidaminobacter sp. JC074 TaxID=2530199 RepID=UPI001F0E29B0|nr:Crp/Fnr family transcriptional regulator [Acidaminobacter sp. JC074]
MTIHDLDMFKDVESINYHTETYSDKAIIKLSGDQVDGLGIVLEGQALMQYINEEGQLMTITDFSPGQTFGGNRLFCNDNTIPMTITAKGTCVISYVSKETILELCQTNQHFLIHFLKDLSSKSDILSSNIRQIKFVTIEDQIIHYLTSEMKKRNAMSFELAISKKEWAEQLGIQRTSLSRTLQKMQKKGWISYKNHHYQLINHEIFC